MKKSNALMLSYIIFLIIALWAHIIWEWSGLEKIAMAATIAGCFFAFADFYEWQLTFKSYYCDKVKEIQKNIIDIETAEIMFIDKRRKELEYILEKATPYKGLDSEFDKLINFSTETLENDKKSREDCEQSIAEFTKLYEKTIKRNNKKFEIASLVLFVFGFVAFFSIIAFDFLAILLTNYQTFTTVVAFAVIMCNYYFKDVIEKDVKAQLNNSEKKSNQSKNNQDELNSAYIELDLSNKIDEFIERFKETKTNSNDFEEN